MTQVAFEDGTWKLDDDRVNWSTVRGGAFSTQASCAADAFVFNSGMGTDPLIAITTSSFNGPDTANLSPAGLTADGVWATASFLWGEEATLDAELFHIVEEITDRAVDNSGLLMEINMVDHAMFLVQVGPVRQQQSVASCGRARKRPTATHILTIHLRCRNHVFVAIIRAGYEAWRAQWKHRILSSPVRICTGLQWVLFAGVIWP